MTEVDVGEREGREKKKEKIKNKKENKGGLPCRDAHAEMSESRRVESIDCEGERELRVK